MARRLPLLATLGADPIITEDEDEEEKEDEVACTSDVGLVTKADGLIESILSIDLLPLLPPPRTSRLRIPSRSVEESVAFKADATLRLCSGSLLSASSNPLIVTPQL